jgi:hypothetical protein
MIIGTEVEREKLFLPWKEPMLWHILFIIVVLSLSCQLEHHCLVVTTLWPYWNSSINFTGMKFLGCPNKCTDVCVIYLVSGAFRLRDLHNFMCLVCEAAACVCIIKSWWEIKEHSLKTTDLKRQEEICTHFMRWYNIAIIHVNRVSVINFVWF